MTLWFATRNRPTSLMGAKRTIRKLLTFGLLSLATPQGALCQVSAQPISQSNVAERPPVTAEPPSQWIGTASSDVVQPNQSTLPAPNVSSELTIEHIEQLACANNPAIAVANARVQAARGKWVQAGLPPNPTVGYAADEIGDDGAAGQQGAFFGQQFITGHKLKLDREVAAQEVSKAEQELAAAVLRVRTDARQNYYAVLIAQRKLEMARDLVSVSDKAVETSERLLKAKEISQVALLQTQVQAQTAKVASVRAQNEYVAAWRLLTSVAGIPQMEQRQLTGNLDAILQDLDWDTELNRLTTESPEVASANAELESARWALERAYAQRKPDIDLRVSVQHDNSTHDNIAGVEVGFPLPVWNRNQGGIQQAHGQMAVAERDIERIRLDLRRRLAIEFQQYANARYQVTNLSTDVLPKTKETFDLVTKGYQSGEVGYLELLIAQRTYFETNLSYFEAVRDLWQSRLRIEGMLLDSSLQSTRESQ